MSKINVNTWEPESSTAMTMGASGDTTTVPSGASLVVASGATINITGATQTGFPSAGFANWTPVTATDTTFDLQTGTTKVLLEVQSSGGSCGSNSSAGYEGGMGGGGSYAKKLLTGMTGATDKLNITIGAVPSGNGAAGTTTSVAQAGTASFTTVTCTGGANGTDGTASVHGPGGAGGAAPTTGDLNRAGGDGMGGGNTSNRGTSSMLGTGGIRIAASVPAGGGGNATGYGAGGGRAFGSSQAGGTGSGAVVIVWEFK
jgi:hypothetical protein